MAKSILDGVPVDDKAFPLSTQIAVQEAVWVCENCGARIFVKWVSEKIHPEFTCQCGQKKTIQDLMQIK